MHNPNLKTDDFCNYTLHISLTILSQNKACMVITLHVIEFYICCRLCNVQYEQERVNLLKWFTCAHVRTHACQSIYHRHRKWGQAEENVCHPPLGFEVFLCTLIHGMHTFSQCLVQVYITCELHINTMTPSQPPTHPHTHTHDNSAMQTIFATAETYVQNINPWVPATSGIHIHISTTRCI